MYGPLVDINMDKRTYVHVYNNPNMFDVVEFFNFAIFDKKISFKNLIA